MAADSPSKRLSAMGGGYIPNGVATVTAAKRRATLGLYILVSAAESEVDIDLPAPVTSPTEVLPAPRGSGTNPIPAPRARI